jgi:hypothetical protein
MWRLFVSCFFAMSAVLAQDAPAPPALTLPAATKVELGLTSPIWARTAAPGDSVYAETTFPVVSGGAIAIPPGTYVKGSIDILFRATPRAGNAELRMSFTELVFANGYTVALPAVSATVDVKLAAANDVLMDNGAQIEMSLDAPLELDAVRVAAAALVSKRPKPRDFRSASRCVPTPPSAGSSGTVIPGTPSTPDTVIPGGPGMPPTVIPGTPGTPSSVIGATPDSPGIPCPGRPEVTTAPLAHNQSFELVHPVALAGKTLPAGGYEVAWEGLGPLAQARIVRRGKTLATVPVTVLATGKDADADYTELNATSGGAFSLKALRFRGRNFALQFEP